MQVTINSLRYDTDRCKVLAERDHYNNGTYSGTTRLIEASNGELLVWTDSNGQDLYLRDCCEMYTPELHSIDDFQDIKDDARLVELGLLTIVE